MSSFIIPMSSLPSLSALSGAQQTQQAPQKAVAGNAPFSDFLQKAVEDLSVTGETSRSTLYDLALGQTDDLHTGAIAGVKASTAINFTSSLVSTAIRSYKELMQMQI